VRIRQIHRLRVTILCLHIDFRSGIVRMRRDRRRARSGDPLLAKPPLNRCGSAAEARCTGT
jgi:hypothetical protein